MSAVFHRLGPYEVLSEIGRGGMAQVFLATDTRTGDNVALKVVSSRTDRDAREILAAEESGAELQRQFSQASKHVPAVYWSGYESGYFLVAMEYLDGENLSEVIARGAIQVERAVNIAIELCAFLELAHKFEAVIGDRKLRSLVHGDLKPQNVRITGAGTVKVLDFGIAKALSLSRKVTRNDFGTTPYLSPERLDGDVNEFADLWAVGVMLHEMIRGMRPFDAPDTQRLERLIRSRIPPQPLTGRCPLGLEAVVARLLGPRVAVRYESARAIREDLERFTSGKQTTAEEQGWPARSPDLEATSAFASASAGQASSSTSASGDEATRRTRPAATPPRPAFASASARQAGPVALTGKGASPAALQARQGRGRPRKFLLLSASIFLMFALMANECSVAGDARKVAQAVSTQELDDLGDSWRAHEVLTRRSYLRWGTLRLERSLTQRTLSLADRVIANYRMALPTVREAQWQSARTALARALRIASSDRELRAAYRYCDGHLHRINGEAKKARDQDDDAQRELSEAVASFREAADLRPDWPDPFLGLARTFIYGLEDIDRGADALNQAEQRGYMPTERETGQLADGYRTRGTTLVRNARTLSGMPQESDYLTRAVEAYQRALTLYAQATNLANSPMNIRLTHRLIDEAQHRLDELTPSTTEPVPAEDAVEPAPESRARDSAQLEEAAP